MPDYWLGDTAIGGDEASELYRDFLGYEKFLKITLIGFKELNAGLKATLNALTGAPMDMAMRDIVTGLQREVIKREPKDLGILRASTVTEVKSFGAITEGIVGTPTIWGLAHEQGTGTFIGRPRHTPPPSKLVGWVRRKVPMRASWIAKTRGIQRFLDDLQVAFLISRIIGRRGGLRPQWYFKHALESYWPTLIRKIDRAIVGIIESK